MLISVGSQYKGVKYVLTSTRFKWYYWKLLQNVILILLREMICEHQLKFTGHSICMPKYGPANRFFIYESKIKSSVRPDAPTKTYLNQISPNCLPSDEKALEAKRKMAVNKSICSQHFVVSKKKKYPDRSFYSE